MWCGAEYEEYQKDYQQKSGKYLIEKLSDIVSLKNKTVLDLGCGDGSLTKYIQGLTGRAITAVDNDNSMIEVFKRENINKNIRVMNNNIKDIIEEDFTEYDIIFSNAVFHWLGTNEDIKDILKIIRKRMKKDGVIALRFSLEENALEIKQYLEEKIRKFKNKEYEIHQSKLNYKKICSYLLKLEYEILYKEELKYHPFDNEEKEFQFMIKSQPIYNVINPKERKEEFEEYLREEWGKK